MTPEDGSKTTTEGKTKTIASPRMMQNLSPIASLAERHGVNFQPPSQNTLLKYAVNKDEEVKDFKTNDLKSAKQLQEERKRRAEEL